MFGESKKHVYLVAIPDDFERRSAIDEIASRFPEQSFAFLSAANATLSELLTEIDSPSLFGGGPVAIVDEIEKLPKKNAQIFIDLLPRLQSGCLIFGSRGKSPLFSVVEQCGVLLDLTEEKPWEKEKRLVKRLNERAKRAGKTLASDVPALLFERLDKNTALLEQEIDKLICFTGERAVIERADVLQVSPSSRTHTLWQIAEEIVWEGGSSADLSDGLIPVLRSQFQQGLKIASLVESGADARQIGARLPKIWPKTLDKRISQATRFGSPYFRKGLDLLFRIESLSRSGSADTSTLLDFFRVSLHVG